MAKQAKARMILLVEDDRDDYLLTTLAARRAGVDIQFQHAQEGGEAVRYLSGSGAFGDRTVYPLPAIILADLKMPHMNGLELLKWARAQPLIRRIPFIMLSASSNPGDIAEAYEQGVSSYLVKSTTLDEHGGMLSLITEYWLELNLLPDLTMDQPRSGAESTQSNLPPVLLAYQQSSQIPGASSAPAPGR
jgi:CheY-like chemotaxis protein